MIVPTLARLIIREHLYKPITGKVLCLGRQTIWLTRDQAEELFRQEGLTPAAISDEQRRRFEEKTRFGKDAVRITDEEFFAMLGLTDVVNMDVSTYEGAEIIHDLNYPIPEDLVGKFDFIIDGGTFDHLFDFRVAFANVVRLLNPEGGRIFQWNAASNFTGRAYISFGPDFFYDYYVANQFADCKVYVSATKTTGGSEEQWELYLFEGADRYDYFPSDRVLQILVMAERQPSSTFDKMPIQAQYRDDEKWEPYRRTQKQIAASKRPTYTATAARVNSLPQRVWWRLRHNGPVWVIKTAAKTLKLKAASSSKLEGYRYIGLI